MIQALDDKVIVEPMRTPDMSSGGIWIPDQAISRFNQGIVKYIGPKVKDVKIGDHVIFSGYAGTLMQLEGEGLVIILPESFIQAIIEEEVYEIPGLYFKDSSGEYFQANYEQAMHIISLAAAETDWFRKRKFIETPKTTAEEYVGGTND